MVSKLIDESLNILRKARERYRRVYVMFSGGKDSLVALDLAAQVFRPDEMKIVFIEVTGNTDKCNIDYVYHIHSKYYHEYELLHLRQDFDFFRYMVKAGLPGINARWCMRVFKQELIKRLQPPFFVVGIKRSDSKKRSMIYTSFFHRSKYSIGISILPILNWSKQDVYDYIRQQGLELSPCYKKYGHSGNCMFCPYHNKKAITMTLQDPYWKQKILAYLDKIYTTTDYAKRIKKRWIKNPVLYNHKIDNYEVIQ